MDHVLIVAGGNQNDISFMCIPPGGVVDNMLALHAVNLGSIPGRGDT